MHYLAAWLLGAAFLVAEALDRPSKERQGGRRGTLTGAQGRQAEDDDDPNYFCDRDEFPRDIADRVTRDASGPLVVAAKEIENDYEESYSEEWPNTALLKKVPSGEARSGEEGGTLPVASRVRMPPGKGSRSSESIGSSSEGDENEDGGASSKARPRKVKSIMIFKDNNPGGGGPAPKKRRRRRGIWPEEFGSLRDRRWYEEEDSSPLVSVEEEEDWDGWTRRRNLLQLLAGQGRAGLGPERYFVGPRAGRRTIVRDLTANRQLARGVGVGVGGGAVGGGLVGGAIGGGLVGGGVVGGGLVGGGTVGGGLVGGGAVGGGLVGGGAVGGGLVGGGLVGGGTVGVGGGLVGGGTVGGGLVGGGAVGGGLVGGGIVGGGGTLGGGVRRPRPGLGAKRRCRGGPRCRGGFLVPPIRGPGTVIRGPRGESLVQGPNGGLINVGGKRRRPGLVRVPGRPVRRPRWGQKPWGQGHGCYGHHCRPRRPRPKRRRPCKCVPGRGIPRGCPRRTVLHQNRPDLAPGTCPRGDGWMRLVPGTCVKLVEAGVTFEEAERQCFRECAYLVEARTSVVWDELVKKFGDDVKWGGKSFWMGITDRRSEGRFVYTTDGSPANLRWRPGEPNGGNCVRFMFTIHHDNTHGMEDRGCSEAENYMCQFNLH